MTGIRLKLTGITSSHEEADHFLVQQYQGEKVRSISYDTCVNPSSPFVCLTHVYTCFAHELPMANRAIVDLAAIVQKNKDTPKDIMVMHARSGADTGTATYNMGKQLARKALETTNPEKLSIAGDLQADLDEVCRSEIWMRTHCVQACKLHV